MNRELIEQFSVLQDYFKKSGDKGRSIAYSRAISALRTVDKKITNLNQVKNIRGIGPKVMQKIDEYLRYGKIRVVEEKKEELKEVKNVSKRDQVISQFKKIWGIGPVKAKLLYDQEGIHSLNSLKRNSHLLTSQQKIGLKYYDELQRRIPQQEITVIYAVIKYILNKYLSTDYLMDIAGSYRRGLENSGDIDCLLSTEKFTLSEAVEILRKKGLIVEVLAMKKEKFIGIARCPGGGPYFQLDIEFVDREEWGSALLYFTGSKGFNVYLRAEAKRKGMLLNEHGLYSIITGEKILFSPTEKDIFLELGVSYVPPERR